jgi:hypothetical protein
MMIGIIISLILEVAILIALLVGFALFNTKMELIIENLNDLAYVKDDCPEDNKVDTEKEIPRVKKLAGYLEHD